MTPPAPIAVHRVRGSHREIGSRIGEICGDTIRRAVAFDERSIPQGRSRAEQLELADRYLAPTLAAYPWYAVSGEPTVFAIGNGVWMSCGWNDAGISLSGNELAPLDERVGIPREVQYRAMLRQPTLDRALGEALRHDRASSYNQVLVTSSGDVIDVEGSATDAELIGVDDRGHLVHTNHYTCPRMSRYEGEPDCLCRHPERVRGPNDSATTFWWVADLTEMRLRFGRGNACDSIVQEHRFAGARESAA